MTGVARAPAEPEVPEGRPPEQYRGQARTGGQQHAQRHDERQAGAEADEPVAGGGEVVVVVGDGFLGAVLLDLEVL